MKKGKTSNKEEKVKPSVIKSIDWDSMPEKDITLVFKGKERKCGKPSAKLLVEQGLATLA